MCWVLTWTKYQCECPWSARSRTATQQHRPNLYQSVAAICPCCLACSVASSTEDRACHRVGTDLNSLKVTLWFNGDAFFKTASSFSLLPQCLVHLCHKHWLCISPLAVEAPREVVWDINQWQTKPQLCWGCSRLFYLPTSFKSRTVKESCTIYLDYDMEKLII